MRKKTRVEINVRKLFFRVRFSMLYVGTTDAKDIKIGEAGWYKTRFDIEIWGVKINYSKTMMARSIKQGNMEIEVDPIKATRTKIVSVPEIVKKIFIIDEDHLENAMHVA